LAAIECLNKEGAARLIKSAAPVPYTNDPEKRWNFEHQLNDLTKVLRPPVEVADAKETLKAPHQTST
jgi:hypothetical protein